MGIFAEPPAKIYLFDFTKTYEVKKFAKIISAETSAKIIFPQKPMNSGFRVVSPGFLLFLYIYSLIESNIYIKKVTKPRLSYPERKPEGRGRDDEKSKNKTQPLWHAPGAKNRTHPPGGLGSPHKFHELGGAERVTMLKRVGCSRGLKFFEGIWRDFKGFQKMHESGV